MRMKSLVSWAWRVAGAVGILWLVGVAVLAPSAPPSSSSGADAAETRQLTQRLKRAVQEMEQLKRQNNDIRAVLHQFSRQVSDLQPGGRAGQGAGPSLVAELQAKLEHAQRMLQQVDGTAERRPPTGGDFSPTKEFEWTRRLVGRSIQEAWWYIADQLTSLKKTAAAADDDKRARLIDDVLERTADRFRVAKSDLIRLSNSDGLDVWREREASDLSDLVQHRLSLLQNPADCSLAKKLVCNLNKGCGYGCQIHHAVYCFIVAYGTQRTLILKSKNWRYNKAGWEDVFFPLSTTCTDASGSSHSQWPGTSNTQVVTIPIVDTLSHRPDFLPLSIPSDLSDRIIRLHGDPPAWWVGQFLKYLLKPQPKTKEMLDVLQEKLGFVKPIVGIHVRRTDKVGTEAAFHPVEEYMSHVEDYFRLLSLSDPNVVRRVYVASDDPSVIVDTRQKFPDYIVVGDTDIAKTAAVATRYSDTSLRGIIADIHFLSMTDYLVCTFSSQVCRIAYELMQTYNPDAGNQYRSLDDIYYYGGQKPHNQRVRFPHTPTRSDELNLKEGDIIGVAGNHWDGFSKGMNQRTHQNGLYPSYKVEEVVDIADTASYREIDKSFGSV